MDLLDLQGYHLRGLGSKNIILGKNGCGKSRLLKTIEQALRSRSEMGALRYLSPERAGLLQYQPDIEQNLTNSPNWLGDSRRQNQAPQFRQQSAAQFRRLELLILREIEQIPALRADLSQTFDRTVDKINTLLDRVCLKRGDPSFQIIEKATNNPVNANEVSSGESELISLGIECLVFTRDCIADRTNVLMIDEPDVHLHPDLQARFAKFLEQLVAEHQFVLIGATHSTAFLGALTESDSTCLALMRAGDMDLKFSPIDYTHRRILPVFGAHPLSNVFNEAPVLLVEGEDDERIWQQAVRSSQGRIRIYPVSVDSVDELATFESQVSRILDAVYDQAVGYSLRDRDENIGILPDIGAVKRFRLKCRAAENLLLTDDVLQLLAIDWSVLESRIRKWVASNASHPHFSFMKEFVDGGLDRLNADLKEIRNDLVGLMGSSKPWEVIVGQGMAAMQINPINQEAHTLHGFLGVDVCQALLKLTDFSGLAARLTNDGN